LKAAGVSAKEVQLAKRLIDDMTEHWKPEEFKDTYHDDLMARIKEKIKQGETKEITEPDWEKDSAPRLAPVVDLAGCCGRALQERRNGAEKPAARKTAATRASPSFAVVAGSARCDEDAGQAQTR
jgi:DNA end-binding protein Ku